MSRNTNGLSASSAMLSAATFVLTALTLQVCGSGDGGGGSWTELNHEIQEDTCVSKQQWAGLNESTEDDCKSRCAGLGADLLHYFVDGKICDCYGTSSSCCLEKESVQPGSRDKYFGKSTPPICGAPSPSPTPTPPSPSPSPSPPGAWVELNHEPESDYCPSKGQGVHASSEDDCKSKCDGMGADLGHFWPGGNICDCYTSGTKCCLEKEPLEPGSTDKYFGKLTPPLCRNKKVNASLVV